MKKFLLLLSLFFLCQKINAGAIVVGMAVNVNEAGIYSDGGAGTFLFTNGAATNFVISWGGSNWAMNEQTGPSTFAQHYFTTNAPHFPSDGSIYLPDKSFSGSYPAPSFTFYMTNFMPMNAFTNIISTSVPHLWPTNGGRANFYFSGYNDSTTASNSFAVLLDTNLLFVSQPTAGYYHPFNVAGVLNYDGSNLMAAIQFQSGDTNLPLQSSFVTLTNIFPTNSILSFGVDATMDTNVIYTGGTASSSGYVPGFGPASYSLVATLLNQAPITIATATSSTYGLGAGQIAWDTNYIYVSVGTNSWKRASISSW